MRQMGKLACTLGEHRVLPKDTIKVLGVLLDSSLSWEAHCAAAAGRALRAIRAVARSARYLSHTDRGKLIRALAHPHLDYCQSALAEPSVEAQNLVRRMYNRSARVACKVNCWWADGQPPPPCAPLRARLRWPSWERRRCAARAALVARIHHTQEPADLAQCIPPPKREEDTNGMQLRSVTNRMLPEEGAATRAGAKAFSVWAPSLLNAISTDTVFQGCPEADPPPKGAAHEKPLPQQRAPPEDPDRLEREAFHAYLRSHHASLQTQEVRTPDGKVAVWTDGSFRSPRAGAGIFYGYANPRNRIVGVPGRQTNNRGELTALLTLLETDARPLSIRTDSMYVHLGVTVWRAEWRANAWFRHPLAAQYVDHVDLW
eukprot:gene1594-biopygen16244